MGDRTGSLWQRIGASLTDLPSEILASAEASLAAIDAAGEVSVAGFRRLLKDPDAKVDLRSKVAWLVGLAGMDALIPELEELVDEGTPRMLLWEVAKALPALETGARRFRNLLASAETAEARKAAIYALGVLRDEVAVPCLAGPGRRERRCASST